MRSLCISILSFLALTAATAADIDVRHLESGSTLIVVEGDLELGDIETFRVKTEGLPVNRTTVEFRSKGGRLLAGIRVGAMIRSKKLVTIVPDGAQCASACALAWLGGTQRFLGESSRVGFHTAFIVRAGGAIESGPGNAILGAYLNQLGLSEKAILYITHAAPTSMQWMSMEEAAEYGITVAPLPRSSSNGAVTMEHPEGSPERRAIDFVLSLVERWSGPNAGILPFLEGLYTGKVLYYGKSTPRQAVVLTKRQFASRWTQRTYSIRPSSLSATCAGTEPACRVKGTMSWKFHDAKTSNSSRGVASFEYSVILKDGRPQIAAEISSINEEVSAAPSSLEQMGRSLQQLLAQLSRPRPAKAPARPKAPVAH